MLTLLQENYRGMVELAASLRESYTTRLNTQVFNIKQVVIRVCIYEHRIFIYGKDPDLDFIAEKGLLLNF